MITVETVVAFALKNTTVMDVLGPALRSDIVLANPHYRRLVEFADDFLMQRRKLPAAGDWDMWLESLPAGLQRDGVRDALGRMLALDVSQYDAAFFGEQAIGHLRKAAAEVARSRMNAVRDLDAETFANLARKVDDVRAGSIEGLARLRDIEIWSQPDREHQVTPTGYRMLDKHIRGWGQEMWIVFADSGVGKSMILQNFGTACARSGRRVLHVTLELNLRPQIQRYYRQIAQAFRGEFQNQLSAVQARLKHWIRLAKGEVLLLEYPAYGLDTDTLQRTIERVGRQFGDIDVVVLDYLDLLTLPKDARGHSKYEDLGRLTHQVRALCMQYDVTVLTASQAVRRPENAGRLTIRDMGDSYNKVRGADGILGLNQTQDERVLHQGRLGLLKVRDGGGRDTEIPLYINPELSVVAELDHPNTVALMRKLGHLPTQPPAPAVAAGGKP